MSQIPFLLLVLICKFIPSAFLHSVRFALDFVFIKTIYFIWTFQYFLSRDIFEVIHFQVTARLCRKLYRWWWQLLFFLYKMHSSPTSKLSVMFSVISMKAVDVGNAAILLLYRCEVASTASQWSKRWFVFWVWWYKRNNSLVVPVLFLW